MDILNHLERDGDEFYIEVFRTQGGDSSSLWVATPPYIIKTESRYWQLKSNSLGGLMKQIESYSFLEEFKIRVWIEIGVGEGFVLYDNDASTRVAIVLTHSSMGTSTE